MRQELSASGKVPKNHGIQAICERESKQKVFKKLLHYRGAVANVFKLSVDVSLADCFSYHQVYILVDITKPRATMWPL